MDLRSGICTSNTRSPSGLCGTISLMLEERPSSPTCRAIQKSSVRIMEFGANGVRRSGVLWVKPCLSHCVYLSFKGVQVRHRSVVTSPRHGGIIGTGVSL
jgi:hypothetical protein